MPDPTTAPLEASRPDPPRPVPARIGRVLGILRTLITYGTNVADALNQHASPAASPPLLQLHRHNLRQQRHRPDPRPHQTRPAPRRRARRMAPPSGARGRDLQLRALRPPAARKPRTSRSAQDPHLPSLTTLEQIAAQDRRRPIGAVLVDICLDLGIIPGQMDPASWGELGHALALYGGDLATLARGACGPATPAPPAVPPPAPAPCPFTSPARPA